MNVYRINKEPYHEDPLSIIGSERYGGRWNPKGVGILYASLSPELALLETLVHLPPVTLAELPRLWLSTLRVPDDDDAIFWTDPSRLPSYWQYGSQSLTQQILADWLDEPFSAGIAVPSAIIDVSYNLLLHPLRPAFSQIKVINQRTLPMDSRLRQWREGEKLDKG